MGTYVRMSTRAAVLEMLENGKPRAEIARTLGVAKSTVAYHCRRAREPDPRFRRRYDWKIVQDYYDLGQTVNECVAHFGFSKQTWHAAKNRGAIVTRARAMSIEQLLCGRRDRTHLEGRPIKEGLLPERCRSCGLIEWRGKRLALELHHINGDGHDNRLDNLAPLCPNCHSQTDTWGGRNSRRRNPKPRRDSH
jgi:5-methylcytosine-specific restriction endonuclease McrA